MPQFRNVGADPVFVSDLNAIVEPDELIEAPGEISSELEDAYVVSSDAGDRAWPKSQWTDTTPAKKTAAKKSAEKE